MLAIAKDYYTTGIGTEKIAKKHKVSLTKVHKVINQTDPRSFTKDPDWCVVKVPREKMELVRVLMEGYGVPIDVPEKFELTEYCESKMNVKEEE